MQHPNPEAKKLLKSLQLYRAVIAETGKVVADKIEIAEDFCSRSVGLLNRKSLEPGEGLLIKPCNSIHTFFMRFSIDVVFLDKNGVIVKMVEAMPPWRLSSCVQNVYMTLELTEGTLKNKKISIGSSIKLQKTT